MLVYFVFVPGIGWMLKRHMKMFDSKIKIENSLTSLPVTFIIRYCNGRSSLGYL
jgi:hypothetical protein